MLFRWRCDMSITSERNDILYFTSLMYHYLFSFHLWTRWFPKLTSTDQLENNLLLIGFPEPTSSVRTSLLTNILALFCSVLAQALYKKLNQYFNKFKLNAPPSRSKENKPKKDKKVDPLKSHQKELVKKAVREFVEDTLQKPLTKVE